jgi:hypothetical protein
MNYNVFGYWSTRSLFQNGVKSNLFSLDDKRISSFFPCTVGTAEMFSFSGIEIVFKKGFFHICNVLQAQYSELQNSRRIGSNHL